MADGDGSGAGADEVPPGGEPKGLEGAITRGVAAKEAWVRDGLLVGRETLAKSWGVSLKDVAAMVERGDLFELDVGGQPWVPAVFLELPWDIVAEVNRALAEAGADAATALVFWHRKHGALGGMTAVQALVLEALTESVAALARTGRS